MEKEKLIALVTAAQGGDGDAMNELFEAFYDDVHYFALKTLKNDELAMEICQETFLEVIETLGNLREPAAFVTWLKRIAYHRCTAYFKKKKEVLVEEDEEGHSLFDDVAEEREDFIPGEGLEKEDFKQTILSMLDTLSEEQRSAVMLHYFNEMSVADIASVQGVSEGTVKSRLNYARKAIRASVEEYEKKHGIRLHALPFFPFMGWLLENTSAALPMAAKEAVSAAVTAAMGGGGAVAAGTATAAGAGAAATATASAGASAAAVAGVKAVTIPLAAKIVAGVVAATLVVGGGAGGYYLATRGEDEPAFATVETETEEKTGGGAAQTETGEKTPAREELILEGVLPEGCTYVCADGTVLEAGAAFPAESAEGDIVLYGDYSYTYEGIINPDYLHTTDEPDFTRLPEGEVILMKIMQDVDDMGLNMERDMLGGWYPQITDPKKESYGEICAYINKKPIRAMYITFIGSGLKDAGTVRVPSTVEWMIGTFWDCKELITAKELKLPPSVWNASLLFHECPALVEAPVLPATLRWVDHMFWRCYSLTGEIKIVLDPEGCNGFLSETRKPINLVGENLSVMANLASSATENNVSINGVPFDVPRPTPSAPVVEDTRILTENATFRGETKPYMKNLEGTQTQTWCIRPVQVRFFPNGGTAYDAGGNAMEVQYPFAQVSVSIEMWYIPREASGELQVAKDMLMQYVAEGNMGVPATATWEELFDNEAYFKAMNGAVIEGIKYILYVPAAGGPPDYYQLEEGAEGVVTLARSPELMFEDVGVSLEKAVLAKDGQSLWAVVLFDQSDDVEMTLQRQN